jgi:hypothetical protein
MTRFCALLVLAAAPAAFAGPLSPPAGAVATSMKTLAEIEPRTTISAATTPGDADSLYRITAPGSYYLTGNLQGAAGKHGIEVAVNGVTIDLNGFSLLGTATSLDGIKVDGFRSNITVSNGSATGWAGWGVNMNSATEARVSNVRATANTIAGIGVSSNSVVTDCSTHANGAGIYTGTRCSVVSCTSSDDLGIGIRVDSGSTVRDCAAWGAGTNGGAGIYGDIGSTIINCAARACEGDGIRVDDSAVVQGCSVTSNAGYGIYSPRSATVTDCCCGGNDKDGIRVKDNSYIRGNNLTYNGLNAANAAGICITGTNNRVEGNNCSWNDRGVEVQGAGNFVNRNTCRGNTTNYVIAANNACYCVQATLAGAINGSNGGTSFGSTDPNANFSY